MSEHIDDLTGYPVLTLNREHIKYLPVPEINDKEVSNRDILEQALVALGDPEEQTFWVAYWVRLLPKFAFTRMMYDWAIQLTEADIPPERLKAIGEEAGAYVEAARAVRQAEFEAFQEEQAKLQPFTVIGYYEDSGLTFAFHVRAQSDMAAFSVVASEQDDPDNVMFVVCLPGHQHEGKELAFPGEGVVLSRTVLEQPEVFDADS